MSERLFYRQIRKKYCPDPHSDTVDEDAFSTHGTNLLSFADGDKKEPLEALEDYNRDSRGKDSVGVLAVSLEECENAGVSITYAVDADWHVQLDFSKLTKEQKELAKEYLFNCAITRGWEHIA